MRDFTGHGLGTALFNGLIIPSYEDPRSELVMEPGHAFTVHPILTIGPPDHVVDDDKWTIRTKTGRRSAEAMHTVLVTEKGAEILTETGPASHS